MKIKYKKYLGIGLLAVLAITLSIINYNQTGSIPFVPLSTVIGVDPNSLDFLSQEGLTRVDLQSPYKYSTEGYVVHMVDCPPCPVNRVCAPCPQTTITICDKNINYEGIQTHVAGNCSTYNTLPDMHFKKGEKYRFAIDLPSYKSQKVIGYRKL